MNIIQEKRLFGTDDLFSETKSPSPIETIKKSYKDENDTSVFKYNYGEEFLTWQKDNYAVGRPHVICCVMEFLHNQSDDDVLKEAFDRLIGYLSLYPGKFSNIALSRFKLSSVRGDSFMTTFNIACDFRNNNVSLFLNTVATLFSILMYIYEQSNKTDSVHFDKYQIAYYPWNDDEMKREINHISNNHQFEEIVYQIRNTFRHKQKDDLAWIVSGVDDCKFFSLTETELYRSVISWVQKNQERKTKIPLKWSINNIAKERLWKSNQLTVCRRLM